MGHPLEPSLPFRVQEPFSPKGDQPKAIEELVHGLQAGVGHQVLLGVTGSGKTFTMAKVIEALNRPALVIAPNKTLAAQLYQEFASLFPENAVEFFISYYDYYQPEAYVPETDTYIEKDSAINDDIDKMRHSATRSLLTRRDVLIVASVSCIYGLGEPETYGGMHITLEPGMELSPEKLMRELVKILYERNEVDFRRGSFRARGDTLEIFPAHEEERAVKVEFFGNRIERVLEVDAFTGKRLGTLKAVRIFPNSHYVTPEDRLKRAARSIENELEETLETLKRQGKLLEAQRLEQRTRFDLEMLSEMGFCHGIENYSRHLTGRPPGMPPPVLLDYFPKDFLLFLDESHLTAGQIAGMSRGDLARKKTLVEYGFRLPSALDNRPLSFEEFEGMVQQAVYVSATPGPYEMRKSKGRVIEQIIRPTGLLDPQVRVKPAKNQIDDLVAEIKARVSKKERVLVTTLTKRLAEDLVEYVMGAGIRARYLHSDIDALERMAIIRELRVGSFDCLVGVNLLREGLDIPEVSLVAVLDADKEGFLRSQVSLIQTCGRAARNVNGEVLLYADTMTPSMRGMIAETDRRRAIQRAYNEAHGITPASIQKAVYAPLSLATQEALDAVDIADDAEFARVFKTSFDLDKRIKEVARGMKDAAKAWEFEQAASLRDELRRLKALALKWTNHA
ncbi:MAG: excinuclease ABC subunit UvrB [Nitrospirota bacterium]|nr:excinuclease ABC subunit UvrB [Nitrospirota bacterium]